MRNICNLPQTSKDTTRQLYAGLQAHFLQRIYRQDDPVWHETPAVSSAARLADWKLQSLHLPPFVAVRPETQSQVSLTNHQFQFLGPVSQDSPQLFDFTYFLHKLLWDANTQSIGIQQQLCRHRLQLVPAKC